MRCERANAHRILFDGRTPQDLLGTGIYSDLALALYSGPFWSVSVALVANSHLGAGRRGKIFSTALATRSTPSVAPPELPQDAREGGEGKCSPSSQQQRQHSSKRSVEEHEELRASLEITNSQNRTCAKDKPTRETSRPRRPNGPAQAPRGMEELHASCQGAASKARGLARR